VAAGVEEAVMAVNHTIGEHDVLLVVDMQNDFCPGGALAVPQGDHVVPLINRLAQRFSHVVLTQDWHPRGHNSFASAHPGKAPFGTITVAYGPQVLWPDHCIQGTAGADFHKDLRIPHAELVLRKGFRPAIDSYSAFYENDHKTPTGLSGYLRERGLKRVVKPVGEVSQADDESQFHDLLLTIVLPQIFEHIITHSGRGPRYQLNVMKRGFVFYVKGFAA